MTADPAEVVELACVAPSRALGLPVPLLRPGAPADLVLRDDVGVSRVMRRGTWLASSS